MVEKQQGVVRGADVGPFEIGGSLVVTCKVFGGILICLYLKDGCDCGCGGDFDDSLTLTYFTIYRYGSLIGLYQNWRPVGRDFISPIVCSRFPSTLGDLVEGRERL